MKRLIFDLEDTEKATLVKAIRLVPGTKLSEWVRRVLMDAATLEIAQQAEDRGK
jgi:hypothetical protein